MLLKVSPTTWEGDFFRICALHSVVPLLAESLTGFCPPVKRIPSHLQSLLLLQQTNKKWHYHDCMDRNSSKTNWSISAIQLTFKLLPCIVQKEWTK